MISSAERESLKPRQIGYGFRRPDEFSPRHFRFQDWAYRVQPNWIEGGTDPISKTGWLPIGLRWQGRPGVFQHGEVLIGERVYRVRLMELA